MPELPDRFLKDAAGLTKNPLGVIGLFLGLVYGAAVIVAGFSPNLDVDQRWLLSIFVVAFPFAILGSFLFLVTKHHPKLYAPRDWTDERNVYGPQPPDLKLERENAEVATIEAADQAHLTETAEVVKDAAAIGPPATEPKPAPRLPRLLPREDLLARVREAEALGMRHVEEEYKARVQRDVLLPGSIANAALDGLVEGADGRLLGIEIRLLRGTKNLRSFIAQARSVAAVAAQNVTAAKSKNTFAFLLLLVAEGMTRPEIERARQSAREVLENIRIPFFVEIHDIDELRTKYPPGAT